MHLSTVSLVGFILIFGLTFLGQETSQQGDIRLGITIKIAGGYDPSEAIPYFVSIYPASKQGPVCGGVLVHKDVIVTAAHCVYPKSKNEATPQVIVGPYKRQHDSEDPGEKMQVCVTHVHQDYEGNPYLGYDIAILFLSRNSTKVPIDKLDFGINEDEGELTMRALGFGKNSSKGFPTVIQVAEGLKYVSNKICKESYEPNILIWKSMLCALEANGRTCKGDSGGPLIVSDNSSEEPSDVLMGLISFGYNCFLEKDIPPGVSTRISKFLSWIFSRGSVSDKIYESDNEECHGYRHVYTPLFPDKMKIVENLRSKRLSVAEEHIKIFASEKRGQFILVEAAKMAVEECLGEDFRELFSKSMGGSKDETFRQQIESILDLFPTACPEPPKEELPGPEVELPTPGEPPCLEFEVLPSAECVLATSIKDLPRAATDVSTLAKSGEEGKVVLENLLDLARKRNRIEELAYVLVHAGSDGKDTERLLNPFLETSLIDLSAAGLARVFLNESCTEGTTILSHVECIASPPSPYSMAEQIILDTAKQAANTRSSAEDLDKLSDIIVELCQSIDQKDACDPALSYILGE